MSILDNYYWEWKSIRDKIEELEQENTKLKAELEKEDKAKMNALNWMSDLSKFWLEQIKKLEEERDFFKEQATLWRNDYKKEYEENKKLNEQIEQFNKWVKASTIIIGRQGEEIRKLKNSIAYWKKKADKNQEKANQIDKIMKLPWVMRDWKINRISVARYYLI